MGQSLAVRVSRWSATHPARLDATVAGAFAAAFVPAGAWPAGWSGFLLSAASAAPLTVRRRFPVAVADQSSISNTCSDSSSSRQWDGCEPRLLRSETTTTVDGPSQQTPSTVQ